MGFAMSANKDFTLTAAFVAVAQGAGSVAFQGQDWDVEWAIAASATPVSVPSCIKISKMREESLDLKAGEFLMLRGRGICSVVADNVL